MKNIFSSKNWGLFLTYPNFSFEAKKFSFGVYSRLSTEKLFYIGYEKYPDFQHIGITIMGFGFSLEHYGNGLIG